MIGDSPDVPQGLTIHSRTESLEVARSIAGEARLLAMNAGIEVVKGTLSEGNRLHVYPPEDSREVTEFYYLLKGTISFETENGTILLKAGDHLVSHLLEGAVVFTAVTDIEFLYVSSKPSFPEISDSLKILKDLARQIAAKDAGETDGHGQRIRDLAYAMGQTLGLSQHRLHLLDYAAYFHDVGKLMVPGEILQKPGPLTPDEWAVIVRHPSYGKELLEPTFMKEAGAIVEQHHERLDGSGYPHGLKGDAISLEAYIIGVADSYDAITSNRPYRKARSHEAAMSELARCAGLCYPSPVIAALIINAEAVAD